MKATIATNRFGLGANEGEINQAMDDPKTWLLNQLNSEPVITFNKELNDLSAISNTFLDYKQQKSETKDKEKLNEIKKAERAFFRDNFRSLSADLVYQSIQSNNSLNYRLLDFFSNHFSVTANNKQMRAFAPYLEREAIANNMLGQFNELLLSVYQHPAMLFYLNNEKSYGPNSRQGKKGRGLNENLAREILELHTLGVDGGYTQSDVYELALGISGWSIARPKKNRGIGFQFKGYGHEPGERTLLNKNFPQKGLDQGKAMINYLANHPSTAQFVCTKLVVHFISDKPNEILVERLTKRWLETQGNIKAVMTELINAEEAWQPEKQKFKTPREYVVSTLRATNLEKVKTNQILSVLRRLGQQPFNAGSPKGYSDKETDWNGSSALMARIDLASMLSSRYKLNAEKFIKNALGESIDDSVYKRVIRAESRQQAMVLALMSPDFQRR